MTQRLAPRQEPYPEDVAELLKRYPQRGGYLLTLFRTFAHSKRFLEKGVANLLDAESPLSLRQREIVILRVTARYGCEYEWGVHVATFSRLAGLSEAQVAATAIGTAADPAWSPLEGQLVRVVDALVDGATHDAESRAFFDATYDASQQLEILSLVGFYHAISNIAQVAALEPEPGAARFPSAAPDRQVGATRTQR